MPFQMDGSTNLSSPWDTSAMSEMMDRRRSSLNDSRRNSLLSISLFDVPLFGIGGGNGSTRNSLGLGGYGMNSNDPDPFAPLAFHDLPILPLTNSEIQQMHALQQTQNNINNLNALLNLTNNSNHKRNSSIGLGTSGMGNGTGTSNNNNISNTLGLGLYNGAQTTSSVIDRLLGDRSESSGNSVPSIITASSYGSGGVTGSISSNNSMSILNNFNNHHNNTNRDISSFHPGALLSSSSSSGLGLYNISSIFSHNQQQDQQQRRTSISLLDHYPRHVPITALRSLDSELSPDQPPAKVVDASGAGFGLSPFSPLSPIKSIFKEKEPTREDEEQQNRSSPPLAKSLHSPKATATSKSAGSALSDAECDIDDEDMDDDDDDNQNRFKPFHEEKWSLRYKELLEFHKENGHAAVPHTYPPNPQLARWVKRQRRQYKLRKDSRQSTMTSERLDMLNNVGFIWDSHDVNWREKLDSLIYFKKEHSHCNVPSNYRDKKLATWVKCQRRQYKLYWDGKPSAMTPQRITELEKVGFEWEIRSTVPRPPGGLSNGISNGISSSASSLLPDNALDVSTSSNFLSSHQLSSQDDLNFLYQNIATDL